MRLAPSYIRQDLRELFSRGFFLRVLFCAFLGCPFHLYAQPQAGTTERSGILALPQAAPSPRWAVKTNLLGWGTASPNAAAEVRIAPKATLNVGLSYNPFSYRGNKKWKHVFVQPEVRYWLCAPFGGHYVGGHIFYSHYNAGGVRVPFGLWDGLEDNRYQGDLYGVGFTYGYSWILSPHWSIEAAAGIGYGFTRYKHYECQTCGNYKGTENRHLFMPTKLAISFIYIIK